MKFVFLSSCAHLALERNPGKVSGGAELQVALLGRELVKRGHEVVLIGTDEGQSDNRVLDGVRARTGGAFVTGALVPTLRAVPRVFRVLCEERPDWVAVMGAGTWVFFLWLMKLRLHFRMAFISGSDIDVNGEYRRMNRVRGVLYEFALARCDRQIAMTEYQRAELTRRGFNPGFYRNLLPTFALEAIAKDVDFLWVSSAQRLKRPDIFLQLAAHLPEARCVMICPSKHDVNYWQEIRDGAANLPNVEFNALVPYHEVHEFFQRSQVFVNTSDFEGFPNTFLQAGLAETALLSLSVDPDGIISRYGAGLCAKGDLQQFERDARLLLNNNELRRKLQLKASKFVAEFHDTNANVDAFLAALAEMYHSDPVRESREPQGVQGT